MIKSIILFVLVQLALLARYLFIGEFEPASYAMTFAFLALPFVLYFVGNYFVKKEQQYIPEQIEEWSFYHRQNVFLNEKPLFKGDVKRGSIQRYFNKKTHYVLSDFFSNSFYLSFTLKLGSDHYDIRTYSDKLFTNQSYWHIFKNGEQIGQAKTVVDLKNTAKLKEVIEAQFGDTVYTTASPTVAPTIQLFNGSEQIGELGRAKKLDQLLKNIKIMRVQNDAPEQLIPLLIHAFYFKNGS